jgi:AcrR family transcriptional regulator
MPNKNSASLPPPRIPPSHAAQAAAPARRRLPLDARIAQILDAALKAFAAHGFAGTRIDDIARLAGLSKGGIYTHFKSKDEIFEALLTRALAPSSPPRSPNRGDEPVNVEVERIIERMYEDLTHPRTILTLRLLLSDGMRVPHRVAHWRRAVLDPPLAAFESLIREGVAEGTLRESIAARSPWLLIAPAIFVALEQLVFDDATPALLAERRRTHIAMMRELLNKPSPRQALDAGLADAPS